MLDPQLKFKKGFFIQDRPTDFHNNSTTNIQTVKENKIKYIKLYTLGNSCPDVQCLAGQIQVLKSTGAVPTYQKLDGTQSREQYHQQKQHYYREYHQEAYDDEWSL